MTLQLQALQENATLNQRQNYVLSNTGKSKVHFKQQTSLCKTSVKPTQLPAIRSFSEDALQSRMSEMEIPELDTEETQTIPPKHVGFVPPSRGSRNSRDNDSVSVEFSQDLDEQRRCKSEKLKKCPVRTHLSSAQRHKSPADGTQFEETQKHTISKQKDCTLTGAHRHCSCFQYNENFPRSITSGPYAAIYSVLNKKQFSLPTPGSLH